MPILTPAGPCPVKLRGFDHISLSDWACAVQGCGDYGRSALRYWLREFVDINSSEYQEVCAALDDVL